MQIKIDSAFEKLTITAITKNLPQNSTLKAGMFLPYKFYEKYNSNTGLFGGSLNTFLLLSENVNVQNVESKMQTLFDKNTKDDQFVEVPFTNNAHLVPKGPAAHARLRLT